MRSRDRLELPPVHVSVEPRAVVRARARSRARVVGAILSFILLAVGVRGVQLCVWPSARTIRAGIIQRYDQMTVRGRRGEILDRHGRRLATSVETPSVIVDPVLVEADEIPELSTQVADILDLSPAWVAERMRRDTRYAKLAARVHPAKAAEIRELGHRALWIQRDSRRYYPEQTLAAQVLGHVNAAGVGREGLEGYLNGYLQGGSVRVQRRRDRHGLTVDLDGEIDRHATQGMTVHTTLDRTIQRVSERALHGVMERHEPESATAIVVDVRTGDILALANVPDFNPNAIEADPAPRRNHAVQDAIEPGSVFKPFTLAAAMEEGLIGEFTPIDCEGGVWRVKRTRIRDDHPHGVIPATEVMKFSSNIGAAKQALRMGPETFLAYLDDFGFSERTGVPLPGERSGFLRDPSRIKPIELATTAYGQGATATPLQLAMAVATLANDGVRMEPRLVTRVEDVHGVPDWIRKPTVAQRVVSVQTARAIARMMVTVTEPGGTATRAAVPGYLVAGKTGTAEKVEDGRYTDARIGSFIGFVPADDPVIAIVVVVDEPGKGSRYGGIVAAPAFQEIASASLRYLGVPPNPDLIDPTDEDDQDPTLVADAEPLRLVWEREGWSLPDFRGRPMREVLVSMQGSGLALELEGGGHAVAQRPEPGSRVPLGGSVAVVFR